MSYSMLPPEEQNSYSNRRRQATTTYGQRRAQSEFDRSGVQANQGIDVRNLAQRFDEMRRNLPGSFNRRGMLNSGLFAQGMQDYGSQRLQQAGDLQRRFQQMLGNLNLQDQRADQDYYSQVADLDTQEAMRRAQIAAQLRGF